ncbi:MAG: DUF4115 domain-containing protein [Proteobacteria bacterium]|nr:DUF4115 domain-containing protein [Pseudomonadota bacterium]
MEEIQAAGPGSILAARRNELGMSLEDLGRITRLTPRTIHALETEEWESFPAPVYVKGFLRSCARALELDGEDLVGRYNALNREADSPKPARAPAPFRKKRISLVLLLALAGVLLLWIIILLVSPGRGTATDEPAGPARDVVTLGRPGAAVPEGEAGEGDGRSMVLDVFALKDTTIKVIVDDRLPVNHRLSKGERIVLTAMDHFNILVEDAGAVRLEMDGNPVPVPGSPGQDVNIRIPPR